SPTSGHISVLGVNSRKLGPIERRQIGYVSENQTLPLWMTVRQLLDYCRGFYPSWDPALEKTLLGEFDLPVERKLKHLSRGMLMKTALLSALCYRPKLLVLDEPFSGLDPMARDEFVQGMLEATALGDWTVFVSSHDIEEVERLADHIGMIDRGRTLLNESAESLLNRFRRIEIELKGEASLDHLPEDWLGAERSGNRVSFVTNRYVFEQTESLCRKHFPEAVIRPIPLNLRQIFLVLSRTGRKTKAKLV
ncbi:MAG: ABC transporter ATP-binding protein, partial [Lacunisphaera sp.]